MVEIRNSDDLEKWLDNREREDAIVIAARAALRVLPRSARIFETGFEGPRENFTIHVFRAIANSRVAAMGPTREFEVTAARAAAALATAAAATLATATAATLAAATASSADAAYSAATAARAAARAAATAAYSAAAALATAAIPAIWDSVSADVAALKNGVTAATLAAAPLWPGDAPEWVTEDWAIMVNALNKAPDEDWGVWTDWYEARLRGDPPNEALERARVLEITEEMWNAGPKVVNAEIRRLIDTHRPTRSELENTISPQPVIKDGKLDVRPNEKYDSGDGSEELATLPTRQRAVIRALLAALSGDRNTSPAVIVALEEYDTEILARGTRPMLGLLNDMHQIVRDEYRVLNKEKFFDSEGGLKRSFLAFTANHKTITEHFPLDIEREALVRETHVDLSTLDVVDLRERVDAVSTATQDAFIEGGVSEDYRKVMERLTEDMRRVAETLPSNLGDDPDRSILDPPEVPWWKRRIITMRGFAGKSMTRIAEATGIWAFLNSEKGKALVEKLRELLDVFWPPTG